MSFVQMALRADDMDLTGATVKLAYSSNIRLWLKDARDQRTATDVVVPGSYPVSTLMPESGYEVFYVEGLAASGSEGAEFISAVLDSSRGRSSDIVRLTCVGVSAIEVAPAGWADGETSGSCQIAAGGMVSEAHQATVTVRTDPAVGPALIPVGLIGGQGHAMGATLTMGPATIDADSQSLVFTEGGGALQGLLTSGDVCNGCTVTAGGAQRRWALDGTRWRRKGSGCRSPRIWHQVVRSRRY